MSTSDDVPQPSVLKQRAAQEIRRRIFAGEMRPGSKVDQDAIAADLGISKLPVREALIALDGEGIIQVAPRRGAFVAELSREDVRDHYWMFGLISGIAAERAVAHLTENDIAALDDLATAMESEASGTSRDGLNNEFHRIINRAAGSRRLLAELKLLSNAIPDGFYDEHPEWIADAMRDHREIVDVLRSRSAGMVRTLIEGHFLRAGNQAVTVLAERGFWSAGT
ncbi:GntR family transcriptional regulator [Gordonia bronchialis]|uniref:GntR family transcriptional regulator n=1 Tax=Gordonia bronchialis TaxID=2054 RepID=UPI00242C0D90|nr:GntR family transcriptional regulator [Gordonia bronchialis]